MKPLELEEGGKHYIVSFLYVSYSGRAQCRWHQSHNTKQAESDLQMRAWHGCNRSWRSHRETSTSRFIWWKASNYRVPIPYHTISRSNCRDMEYLGSLSGSPIEIWRVYSFDFVFEDVDGFSCFLKWFCPLNDLLAWRTSYDRCVWDFKRALGTWLPSIPISASLFQPIY